MRFNTPKNRINQKTTRLKRTIFILFLASLNVAFIGCKKSKEIKECENDTAQVSLDSNYIGTYQVNSIKSNTNLRTGGYIGSNSELIPHMTCGVINLEIDSAFSFVWNGQEIYQDFVYDSNNVITSSSDLQCTPIILNGTVAATTDTSFSLQFTQNNILETAVFVFVNNEWQYKSSQDVFFQGHATLVDGVDTFFPNVILTMVYDKL